MIDRKIIQIVSVMLSIVIAAGMFVQRTKLKRRYHKILIAPLLWLAHVITFYAFVFCGDLGSFVMIWSAGLVTHGVITMGFLSLAVSRLLDG